MQRSFAKTLPFDRLGTDRPSGERENKGGRARDGRVDHSWAAGFFPKHILLLFYGLDVTSLPVSGLERHIER